VPLIPGTRLGPYEIVAAIGAGGMGEVYKARDTRLDRTVAVKILSPDIASSSDAQQRFEREAKAISQLSHPHICALYDVGHQDGTEFLVMELLEGETLAERIAKGALPLEQTVRYATQMADALRAAHRHGIIHRDLKPSNVIVTKSGVKLLDFGLAKPVVPFSPDAGSIPTVAAPPPLTNRGAIAGTVQYMAPELLDGRPADVRSDIYALGAVIYEMATGVRAFRAAMQTLAPPALDRLVRTCLAHDPDERWQSAHDVFLQLEAIAAGEPGERAAARSRPAWMPWTVAALAIAIAAVAVQRRSVQSPSSGATIRFAVMPPAGASFWDNLEAVPLAIAPDGSRLAFIATDGRVQRVWLRTLTGLDATPVNGTEGARSLFWSPDGRSIGFFAGAQLKRVNLPGGAPVTICDAPDGYGMHGTWHHDEILFTSITGETLYRVPAGGGTPAAERAVDPARGELRLEAPWWLPDGRRFIYSVRTADAGGRLMIAEPGRPGRTILSGVTNAQAADPDFLVYTREGALFGQRLDAIRGELIGAPFAIADHVRFFYSTGVARFGVSRSGAVAFHSHWDVERLEWIDRAGRDAGTLARGVFLNLRISPDGSHVAFSQAQPDLGTFDLWVAELARGGAQRLTSAPTSEVNPVWYPDGTSLFFSGGPTLPRITRKSFASGQETLLDPGRALQYADDVTRDGKLLLATERGQNFDLWTIPLDRPQDRTPLIQTAFSEAQARLSPDGRVFAFASNESGRNEIYVSSYPPHGLKTPASTGGGTVPRWSRDGRELFFLSSDRRLMAVPVRTSPTLAVGAPVALFQLPGRRIWKDYDVAPDGTRFLAVVTDVLGDEQPMTVVLNAFSDAGRP
jgi:eukaryotic-like serine/threonine-protein kinase